MAAHDIASHQTTRVKPGGEPSLEPVTLDEARAWLRIDILDHDQLIQDAIKAARNTVEDHLRSQLLTATMEARLDWFPKGADRILRLLRGPVQSITSIKYQDVDDVQQTLDLAKLSQDLNSMPARIRPKTGETWPAVRSDLNVIVIEYKSGYGDALSDIPTGIRAALRMLVLDLYVHPGTQAETRLVENTTYEALLAPHRALLVE